MLEEVELRIAGSETGEQLLVMSPAPLSAVRTGGPGYLSHENNRRFEIVERALAAEGIRIQRAIPVATSGALAGYLLELDGDGFEALVRAAAAATPAAVPSQPVERLASFRDRDGTIGFLHFLPEHMPIVVELPRPPRGPAYASSDDALAAMTRSIQAWARALRPVAPWLEIEVVERHPEPDVRFRWTLDRWRTRSFQQDFASDPADAKPRTVVPIDTSPSGGFTLDWLEKVALGAMGFALGLSFEDEGELAMNWDWLFAQPSGTVPTGRDVERFCALSAQPTGLRVDGRPLQALERAGWVARGAEELVAPCR